MSEIWWDFIYLSQTSTRKAANLWHQTSSKTNKQTNKHMYTQCQFEKALRRAMLKEIIEIILFAFSDHFLLIKWFCCEAVDNSLLLQFVLWNSGHFRGNWTFSNFPQWLLHPATALGLFFLFSWNYFKESNSDCFHLLVWNAFWSPFLKLYFKTAVQVVQPCLFSWHNQVFYSSPLTMLFTFLLGKVRKVWSLVPCFPHIVQRCGGSGLTIYFMYTTRTRHHFFKVDTGRAGRSAQFQVEMKYNYRPITTTTILSLKHRHNTLPPLETHTIV